MGFSEVMAMVISMFLIGVFIVPLIMKVKLTKDPTETKQKIKCNISCSGKKIYHLPGDKLYDITQIDPNKGEILVDTEHDAIKMGFKRSQFNG
jgi:uncharacterized protein YneF (UPF0154 family)